jgi:hypothetical protein
VIRNLEQNNKFHRWETNIMARKFYGFDGQGKVIIERRSSPPSTSEEGRIYSLSGVPYFDTGVAKQKLVKEDGGTYNISSTGTAGDSSALNGQNGAFYQNSSNQNAGTLPAARLTGTYNIDISGNAATATDADTLDGEQGSFYQNSSNQNDGTLPLERLSGTYDINITGTARYG